MGRQGRVFLRGGLISINGLLKAIFQDRPRSSQSTPELNGGEKEQESKEGGGEGKEWEERLNEHEWRWGGFGRAGGRGEYDQNSQIRSKLKFSKN